MTREKVLSVIEIYRHQFERLRVPKTDYPHDRRIMNQQDVLAHCHGMLDQMVLFVRDGRMDKVYRWLGFIQGCLWAEGLVPLEDLKNHNRPDEPLFTRRNTHGKEKE